MEKKEKNTERAKKGNNRRTCFQGEARLLQNSAAVIKMLEQKKELSEFKRRQVQESILEWWDHSRISRRTLWENQGGSPCPKGSP